jgi:hypothetical protein
MNVHEPILSVVIPTHERSRYALHTIRSILNNFRNTEVIVSDTSHSDDLALAIKPELHHRMLVYVRQAGDLSMVENFERACALATGTYVILIGDDDFLGPFAEQIASWAKIQKIELVDCVFSSTYCWPDFRSKYSGSSYAGKLSIRPYDSAIRNIDSPLSFKECLANLGGGLGQMPRLYHGMVSRKLLTRIVDRYGALFGDVSPDIYSSVLLAAEGTSRVRINFPFIVPGSSGGSASGSSATRTHVGDLRSTLDAQRYSNISWNRLVPQFYSVQTVWAHAFCSAVAVHAQHESQINYPSLYAKCLLYHPSKYHFTLNASKLYFAKVGVVRGCAKILLSCSEEICGLILSVFKRVWTFGAPAQVRVLERLDNAEQAYRALKSIIPAPPNLWATDKPHIRR